MCELFAQPIGGDARRLVRLADLCLVPFQGGDSDLRHGAGLLEGHHLR